MHFDLHITIADDSPEAHVVEAIISRDHVSAEEAIRRALRQLGAEERTPAEKMLGAFSSDEDSAVMDEAMKHVRALRETDRLRDLGF